jgi:cell division protease FtsH
MTDQIKRPLAQKSFNWRSIIWILAAWFLIVYLYSAYTQQPQDRETLSYTAFKEQVRNGNVAEVTIQGQSVRGTYVSSSGDSSEKQAAGSDSEKPAESSPQYFATTLPSVQDPDLLPLLENKDVKIHAETTEEPWFLRLLIYVLPWVLIIGFFVYSSKKFQQRMGGGGGIFGFGKSKARLYDRSAGIEVSFKDVAGLANAKKELQEVVGFLKDPSKYTALGGELPHGLLLVGPPGVGKTLMARACAGEADVPFYSISGSEFIEMFVGVGASRVRDMFKKAKQEAPAIIFVDELDSIGRARGTGVGGGHDEREQTLNQILNEMDGFSPHESVVVMSATNRPDVLDPALVRPGRFDRQIHLELPQKNARREILDIHTREVPMADDVDLENLAERTVGFSGADLKNLVNEAALLAARRDKQRVWAEDFDRARDKILMGIEREDVVKDEEKKLIAYHEAGHALLAELMPEADPLQKVSIIPRGRALGATEQVPEEDRHNLKQSYLMDRLAVTLGGRAAEKVVFEDLSTGAADDLKNATQLARRMICQWGMSEKLGPVTFKSGEPHPFLGRELSEPKDYSEETARVIDEEIRRLVVNTEQRAVETLSANRAKLDALADQLSKEETLSREEVDRILSETTAN